MPTIIETFGRARVLLPVVHCIEERFGVFDPARAKALADAIHGFSPETT